jgi:hypothetical protein
MKIAYTLVGVSLFGLSVLSAQHQTMPAGMSHEDHLRQLQKEEELKRRGALAMGFDQDGTVHHFLLQRRGGSIVVSSKNVQDLETIAQIRTHLHEIAASFGNGLFEKPVATHGEVPPGAAVLADRKDRISYRYDDRPGGGAVVMETDDREALNALHAFLRYQIVEHKTGDPLTPQ